MSKTTIKIEYNKIYRGVTTLKSAETKKGHKMSLCRCDACGKEVIFRNSSIKVGLKSCGCLKLKHGDSGTRLLHIWEGMKARCYNENNKRYKDYGGRGIRVCDEWINSYKKFKEDMIGGYNDFLTIDRINVDGNYCKENCRWVTFFEQASNKTNTVYYNGKCLRRYCLENNLKYKAIHYRYRTSGWTLEKAVTTPFPIIKVLNKKI